MTENSSATELVEHSAYPPIKYSVTEATVAELRERYGDVKEVTADNYDDVKAGIQKMTKLRTGVEAHRNELLSDAREFTANVNDEAKRVTKLVADIESPLKTLKKTYDDEQRAIKEKAERENQERVDKINAKIDSIEELGRFLDGMTAEALTVRLKLLEDEVPAEADFMEFHAVAIERHESSVARVTTARYKRIEFEQEQQRLKEEQERLDKEKAEAAAEQKRKDDALRAEREAFEAEKRAFSEKKEAEARAAQEKAEAEEAEKAKAKQAERDREIAEQAAADALAEKQARDEAEAAAEEERLQMAPDREKLARFANIVTATAEAAPELEHDKAQKLLARAVRDLVAIADNLSSQSEKL